MVSKFIYQHRRGTTERWLASDVIPLDGEIIIEERADNSIELKIGDGIHTFKHLQYISKEEITKDDFCEELRNEFDALKSLSITAIGKCLIINNNGNNIPFATIHGSTLCMDRTVELQKLILNIGDAIVDGKLLMLKSVAGIPIAGVYYDMLHIRGAVESKTLIINTNHAFIENKKIIIKEGE